VLTSPGKWEVFVIYFAILAVLVGLSRLPLTGIIKRSLAVIPFVLVIAIFLPFTRPGETLAVLHFGSWDINISREGTVALATILIKAWLSLTALIWLTATTQIHDLLQSSRRLGFPGVLVMILSVMYRYIYVIFEEMLRMKQARDSRSLRRAGLRELRTAGHIIGTLFIRSYERSERIYAAMTARGYDGQIRTLEIPGLRRADIIAGAGILLALVSVGIFNIMGWI
jgi:cobalt/nickel transport system permease protein